MANNPSSKTLLNRLAEKAKELPQELPDLTFNGTGRPAAVLCPLLLPRWEAELSEARFLFIKRSSELRKHAGQIAFPGGVKEDEDANLLDTAFREGAEEVQLLRQQCKVLAELPSAFTPTGFSLQPYFVASVQEKFTKEPGEVEEIMTFEMGELLNCPFRVEMREWDNKEYRVVYFDTPKACIWGVTGRILEFILQHFFHWEPPQ